MTRHALAVKTLRERMHGDAYLPSDAPYEPARRGRGTTPVGDRRPAIVALPESPDDVARVLEHARSHQLDVSVRSGGHDVLGASTSPSGVLLDLARMNSITIDAATGVATAGAGARSGQLGAAAASSGRAAVLGMNPGVGLGGLTLGGGLGWLCGTFGATVDHLLAVDLVTADGRQLRADADQHPDLYWALRGGGGNFGVTTAFTYQLQRVDDVVAGTVMARAEPATFFRFVREYLADSPDQLDIAAGVMTLSGDRCAFVRACWSGNPDDAEAVLEPLTTFGPTLHDDLARRSYHSFVDDTPMSSVDTMFWRGGQLAGLTDAVIDTLVATVEGGVPEGCMVSLLHYLHGAVCRTADGSTPLIREAGHILYNIVATSEEHSPDQAAVEWVHRAAEALQPVAADRTYVNYLSRDDERSVRNAYGHHYERLRAIKRLYDGDNIFHNNRNIPA